MSWLKNYKRNKKQMKANKYSISPSTLQDSQPNYFPKFVSIFEAFCIFLAYFGHTRLFHWFFKELEQVATFFFKKCIYLNMWA